MNMNATLFAQLISFLVFAWFCMKYVWPPLMKSIEKRQKEIAESLSAAELAKQESLTAQSEKIELLNNAKKEAKEIVEQANKRKIALIEEAQQEALREREKIIAQGLAQIESESQKTREALRKELASLVVAGAEKVITRSINESANQDIIDQLVAEL